MSYGLIGVVAAALAAGYCLPARMRRMLHLLQLEHYENARLFRWLRRRGEIADRSMVLAIVLALVAVGARRGAGAADRTARRDRGRRALAPGLRPAPRAGDQAAGLDRPRAAAVRDRARGARGGAADRRRADGRARRRPAVRDRRRARGRGRRRLRLGAGRGQSRRWRRSSAGSTPASSARRPTSSRRSTPRVIGITGSYGKTTTKVCIGAVLSQQLPTLITPASFNSRLGVIRTINEHLEPSHEAFVVEMGMYRKGDITELCELVHPQIGVLTAIGPVHLERLGLDRGDRRRQVGAGAGAAGRRSPGRQRRRPARARDRRALAGRRHRPLRDRVGRRPRSAPSRSSWPTGEPRSRW